MKRKRVPGESWHKLLALHAHDEMASALVDDELYEFDWYTPWTDYTIYITPIGIAIWRCCSACMYAFVRIGADFNRPCFKDGETIHTPLSFSFKGGAIYTTRAILRGGVDRLPTDEELLKYYSIDTDIPSIVHRYRALRALMWSAQNVPDPIWKDIAAPMIRAMDTALRWKDMN
jgi:hypothetical protein